ncbi:hypothetical protein SAMN05216179_3464 [Gracilibacillus kekensis]|uniref:Uncharacterized protein n=1 Tax=Gracilibacillus kekensis TaxID=1027249 RepID=A0A1M7QQF5_9BACI|nr:hypothetical protein SAMN05216179_3464 [Gracilibacillus kekensis]
MGENKDEYHVLLDILSEMIMNNLAQSNTNQRGGSDDHVA